MKKKKINTLCNSCNLDVERIILKNFIRGINSINTFLGKKKIIDIKINDKDIQLSFLKIAHLNILSYSILDLIYYIKTLQKFVN